MRIWSDPGRGGPNQEDGGCKACNSRLLQTSFLSDLSLYLSLVVSSSLKSTVSSPPLSLRFRCRLGSGNGLGFGGLHMGIGGPMGESGCVIHDGFWRQTLRLRSRRRYADASVHGREEHADARRHAQPGPVVIAFGPWACGTASPRRL